MSSQVQPIGTFPSVYRLVSPSVAVDASGGIIEVDNNSKFNTNIPLDRYMLITAIQWYITLNISSLYVTPARVSWHTEYQLTEALARTVVTFSDPVYVDEGLLEENVNTRQDTPVGDLQSIGRITPFPLTHVLANPWATAAQQLNLVAREIPFQTLGLTSGPKHSVSCVIEYQLLPLTPDIRTYLATRVQIAGQA